MPTREQLLDPGFIPHEGTLRWLRTKELDAGFGLNPVLQQYTARDGWKDVPVVSVADLDKAGVG